MSWAIKSWTLVPEEKRLVCDTRVMRDRLTSWVQAVVDVTAIWLVKDGSGKGGIGAQEENRLAGGQPIGAPHDCSGVGFGVEVSGGVEDVRERCQVRDTSEGREGSFEGAIE